jgi:hypothetical protein
LANGEINKCPTHHPYTNNNPKTFSDRSLTFQQLHQSNDAYMSEVWQFDPWFFSDFLVLLTYIVFLLLIFERPDFFLPSLNEKIFRMADITAPSVRSWLTC